MERSKNVQQLLTLTIQMPETFWWVCKLGLWNNWKLFSWVLPFKIQYRLTFQSTWVHSRFLVGFVLLNRVQYVCIIVCLVILIICIVCPSSIYGFRLPLLYLKLFVTCMIKSICLHGPSLFGHIYMHHIQKFVSEYTYMYFFYIWRMFTVVLYPGSFFSRMNFVFLFIS